MTATMAPEAPPPVAGAEGRAASHCANISAMVFSEILRRLREDAGFSSARAFYRARGGRGAFGCTYKAYLDLEGGRSHPQPELALRVAKALEVRARGGAREFVAAYLGGVLRGTDLAEFLLRALRGEPPGPADLFQKASESSFAGRCKALTHAQAELLYRDWGAYWCFTLLSNEEGHWRLGELAKACGLPAARAKSALGALSRAGLAARDKEGLHYCPDTGRVFTYPRDEFFKPRTFAALKSHWDTMAARRGRRLLGRRLIVRGSEPDLRAVLLDLAQTVDGAHIYALRERGPDTGLFIVSASARRRVP